MIAPKEAASVGGLVSRRLVPVDLVLISKNFLVEL